jgi:hypothetical protein
MATTDIWSYRDSTWVGNALVGLAVEATDGEIGTVDEATDDGGGSSIVVDTGGWIFDKKVVLPAGVIERIDFDEERIFVDRTKDEIENAPEYDDSRGVDDEYRASLGRHYTGDDERDR